jgi:mono/diheme cytochrome c family protein
MSCKAMMKRYSLVSNLRLLAAPATALVVAITSPAHASSVEDGRDLAQRLCASCHGIERADRSPVPVAPAFRRLEPQVDLDNLIDRLQGGVIAGHPEMPAFVLREHEARALVAYMRSLQNN